MSLSPENRALVERHFKSPGTGLWPLTDEELNRLIDAARKEGAAEEREYVERRFL